MPVIQHFAMERMQAPSSIKNTFRSMVHALQCSMQPIVGCRPPVAPACNACLLPTANLMPDPVNILIHCPRNSASRQGQAEAHHAWTNHPTTPNRRYSTHSSSSSSSTYRGPPAAGVGASKAPLAYGVGALAAGVGASKAARRLFFNGSRFALLAKLGGAGVGASCIPEPEAPGVGADRYGVYTSSSERPVAPGVGADMPGVGAS